MCADSVLSARKNLRRAGMLKNKERASITVPGAHPASRTSRSLPPSTTSSVPATASLSRVTIRNLDTLAMLGTASPRNPSVRISAKSPTVRSLLVA